MERTLIIIKPDAVQRGIVGDIITRFEKVGLKISGTKMIVPEDDRLAKHYPEDRREFIEGMGNKTLDNHAGLLEIHAHDVDSRHNTRAPKPRTGPKPRT